MNRVERKRWQLVITVAALGLMIGAAYWAYAAFKDYTRPMDLKNAIFTAILTILCPPSLLSIPFWETEPDQTPGMIIWGIIAVLNCWLYGKIGAVVGRRL